MFPLQAEYVSSSSWIFCMVTCGVMQIFCFFVLFWWYVVVHGNKNFQLILSVVSNAPPDYEHEEWLRGLHFFSCRFKCIVYKVKRWLEVAHDRFKNFVWLSLVDTEHRLMYLLVPIDSPRGTYMTCSGWIQRLLCKWQIMFAFMASTTD
jgi:hypothetical protein